jgi:hypothetical protein
VTDDERLQVWTQAIFDHLAGEGSPFAELVERDPEFVAFCATSIAGDVADLAANIRWRTGRTTDRDVLANEGIFDIEDRPDGARTVSLRPEWRQILQMNFAATVEKRGRGRPPSSPDRYRLIATVFDCYPKGTATLSREWGSHFEDCVRLALALAGDRIADVYAEIRAAKAHPDWPNLT